MKTIYSLLCVLCATLFTNANAATLTVADLAGAVNRGDGVVELTSDVTVAAGTQDAEHIEPLIFHKRDNAALGEVIYLPAGSTGLDTVDADSTLAYDAVTATVSGRGSIIVLDSGGRVVASGERQVTASHLSHGAYLATNGQRSIKFIITK